MRCIGLNPTNKQILDNGGTKKFGTHTVRMQVTWLNALRACTRDIYRRSSFTRRPTTNFEWLSAYFFFLKKCFISHSNSVPWETLSSSRLKVPSSLIGPCLLRHVPISQNGAYATNCWFLLLQQVILCWPLVCISIWASHSWQNKFTNLIAFAYCAVNKSVTLS